MSIAYLHHLHLIKFIKRPRGTLMDSMASEVFRSLESYWRRRTYQRLQGSSSPGKKRVIKLGDRRRRSSKLQVTRLIVRLRLSIPSPVKIFSGLRDAYVNSMLVLAGEKQRAPLMSMAKNKRSTYHEGTLMERIPKALKISKKGSEFERTMMIHIYNGLVAPRQSVLSACQ
ncbi:hypothetical protein IHE45_05G137600 [Dioscorea alata]|uniref:Uncharacterized protein n=1 Tax=Dioscorea alata TaxID=55571 RepID=A0ACB7W5M3_DIOAL|nr:hypothetical protein IHE45_05G137600 [Dioscorea alata]